MYITSNTQCYSKNSTLQYLAFLASTEHVHVHVYMYMYIIITKCTCMVINIHVTMYEYNVHNIYGAHIPQNSVNSFIK